MKLSPEIFIKKYKSIAINDSLFSKIPPSITMAQAILESGWAGSELAVKANNYFGIKSHGWDGPSYNVNTGEYYPKQGYTTVKADFRLYGSVQESFADHSRFLHENARYNELFLLDPLDYKGWAVGLKKAGYATSPTYDQKLINLIEQYKLNEFDVIADRKKFVYEVSIGLAIFSAIIILLVLVKILK